MRKTRPSALFIILFVIILETILSLKLQQLNSGFYKLKMISLNKENNIARYGKPSLKTTKLEQSLSSSDSNDNNKTLQKIFKEKRHYLSDLPNAFTILRVILIPILMICFALNMV